MQRDLKLLKSVLSIPTVTRNEKLMIEFICEWLDSNNIEYFKDDLGNVYATKNTSIEITEETYFPCVVSHTDTVHQIDTINVVEGKLPNAQGEYKQSYFGINDLGKPTGIGGDDKCGVFACLTLLKEMNFVKAAFFVSEEIGCIGSRVADEEFFSNVGYAIQFDAPENWMVTETCFSQKLFDRDSEFFQVCDSVLSENMVKTDMDYMSHPYTDVWALRSLFDFSCINFSIGYYNYHTKNEYVVVDDVFNGIKMGKEMIEKLGNKLYYKESKVPVGRSFLWD